MQIGTEQTLDQVLNFLPQAEFDKKGQLGQILKAIKNLQEPKKPIEIAHITGFPDPSVRRNIQVLVRQGLVKKNTNNKYSII